MGSHTVRLRPRKLVRDTDAAESDTTEYFIAGTRAAMRGLPTLVQGFQDETELALQFAEIESVSPFLPADKIRINTEAHPLVFEVGLHLLPGVSEEELKYYFMAYAKKCDFRINQEFVFNAGGMVFLAVEGPDENLPELAKFTLIRVLRPMPRIRGVRPVTRGAGLRLGFQPSALEPVSREPKVAILDGGLPEAHPLGSYVRRYFVADGDADDVPEYLAHGLGVTSAFLFGPIDPGAPSQRPYAAVDHHRVLDAKSDEEDPYELFRTLANVETILLSRQYQ